MPITVSLLASSCTYLGPDQVMEVIILITSITYASLRCVQELAKISGPQGRCVM